MAVVWMYAHNDCASANIGSALKLSRHIRFYVLMPLLWVASSLCTDGAYAVGQLTEHGSFADWQVYRLKTGNLTVCYAATEAAQFSPTSNIRERPVLYISRYPSVSDKNTVEIRFGSELTQLESVQAKLIARRKQPRDTVAIKMLARAGFIADANAQEEFISAMLKGREVVIVSEPGKNEILEDRFSLYGLTKSLKKLEKLCPGPAPKQDAQMQDAQSDAPSTSAHQTSQPGQQTK